MYLFKKKEKKEKKDIYSLKEEKGVLREEACKEEPLEPLAGWRDWLLCED